jgi:integrase
MVDVEEPRSSQAKHEVVPPDLDRLRGLLDHAFANDPEFGLVCRLGAVTGMRRGEIAGLRWSRVDLERGRLEVAAVVNDAGGTIVVHESTKTGVRRTVDIDPTTAELLGTHQQAMAQRALAVGGGLAPDAFVFSHAPVCDQPIRPEYLTRRMRQLRRELRLDDAETDTTLHALRHWTQTTLTEAGYDSRQVAARGGHSEQVMKRVYVHRTAHAEAEMTRHVGELLRPPTHQAKPDE